MDHPNFNCCPLSWDQRIPNEPIFERNLLIERPPQIPQDFPRTTNPCVDSSKKPWLLYDRPTEKTMMTYWHHHTTTDKVQGVNAKEKLAKSLDKMTEKFPEKPWLHGIHRNIDYDSKLSNRNYYNPKDCIIPCVKYDIAGLNRIADDKLFREMTKSRVFQHHDYCSGGRGNSNMGIWNQTTSMKMNEPIDYNYEKFIKSCPELQKYRNE